MNFFFSLATYIFQIQETKSNVSFLGIAFDYMVFFLYHDFLYSDNKQMLVIFGLKVSALVKQGLFADFFIIYCIFFLM